MRLYIVMPLPNRRQLKEPEERFTGWIYKDKLFGISKFSLVSIVFPPLNYPFYTSFLGGNLSIDKAQLTPIPSLLRKEGRAHDPISTTTKELITAKFPVS